MIGYYREKLHVNHFWDWVEGLNTSVWDAVGFSCSSDWLRGWHEYSGPITLWGEKKPKPTRSLNTFDSHSKLALIVKQLSSFFFSGFSWRCLQCWLSRRTPVSHKWVSWRHSSSATRQLGSKCSTSHPYCSKQSHSSQKKAGQSR